MKIKASIYFTLNSIIVEKKSLLHLSFEYNLKRNLLSIPFDLQLNGIIETKTSFYSFSNQFENKTISMPL